MEDLENVNDEQNPENSENEIDQSFPSTPRRLSGVLEHSSESSGSFVWKHFSKDIDYKNNKKATCNHCNKMYICSAGSTSGLSKHLKKVHNIQQNKDQRSEINVLKMLHDSKWSYNQDEARFNLIKWIIVHQHAFTIVEETNFINYIRSLHPSAEIPSADTVKSRIMKYYEQDKEKIKDILANLSAKISFTTDCWTSPSGKSFMAITAHFIDNDWILQHILLDFIEIHESHTGQNLKNAFLSGLESFSIENKIMGITLDNASNNNSFIQYLHLWSINKSLLFNKESHFRCFAHVINLGVQEALTCLEGSISKLREVMVKIRVSPQRKEKLNNACKNVQIKSLKPIIDVPTRWNSTYDMVKRGTDLKLALDSVLLNDSNLKKYLITEDQWKELKKIQKFLHPFKEVTTIMSGSTYPTLSTTIPLYNILIDHLEDIIDNNEMDDSESSSTETESNTSENERRKNEKWNQLIKQASRKCRDKLLEYYNKTNDSYLISIILDPRLKLQYYYDNEWGEQLINEIQEKFLNIFNTLYAPFRPEISNNAKRDQESVMSRIFKRRNIENTNEFRLYLSMPLSSEDTDPLEWWRTNKEQLPTLSRMAQDYLAIPATSVPSEESFSAGKNLITDKRNRLAGKTIRVCLCLRSWWISLKK